MSTRVPERVRWAVELLDVRPDDRILEFGCGPGVAAELVADRLADGDGHLLAIDRSAKAVERARGRNERHTAAGRLAVERIALAELADLAGEADRFDKAFGVNVNVFWTSDAGAELAALAHALRPGGVLLLVYEGPPGRTARDVGPVIAATLGRHGIAADVVRHDGGRMLAVTGRWDDGGHG